MSGELTSHDAGNWSSDSDDFPTQSVRNLNSQPGVKSLTNCDFTAVGRDIFKNVSSSTPNNTIRTGSRDFISRSLIGPSDESSNYMSFGDSYKNSPSKNLFSSANNETSGNNLSSAGKISDLRLSQSVHLAGRCKSSIGNSFIPDTDSEIESLSLGIRENNNSPLVNVNDASTELVKDPPEIVRSNAERFSPIYPDLMEMVESSDESEDNENICDRPTDPPDEESTQPYMNGDQLSARTGSSSSELLDVGNGDFPDSSSGKAADSENIATDLMHVKSEFPTKDYKSVDNHEVIDLVNSTSIIDLIDSFDLEESSSIDGWVAPSKPNKTSNTSKKLLMDVVLAECSSYAAIALTVDPLSAFYCLYSDLSRDVKVWFNQLMIPSLDNEVNWLRCTDSSAATELVDKKLFVALDDQDDFFMRLVILLNSSELSLIFSKLDPHRSLTTEAMRTHLTDDLKNCLLPKCTSGLAEQITTTLFHKRFLRMHPTALLATKMALDVFALPLNLFQTTFKHGEIARYLDNLFSKVHYRETHLIELAQAKSTCLMPSMAEYDAFAESFALKNNVLLPRHIRPRLPGLQNLSELGGTMAILTCSFSHQVNENPIFAYQISNLVRALDEKLAQTHTDDDEEIKAKFFCIGLLLKQEVTHFSQKGVWAKKKMQWLSKIFGVHCEVEQVKDVLMQNVPPLEQHIRMNFVSQVVSSKRRGLIAAERREVAALLKETTFKKRNLKIKVPKGNPKLNQKNISAYEEYYKKEFPIHVLDSGSLLMNSIFLAFWPIIYLPVDDVFFNGYQKSPIDWGGEEFCKKRKDALASHIEKYKNRGIDSVISTINDCAVRFKDYHSIVNWSLVGRKIGEMRSLLKLMGLDNFLTISIYVLQKASERLLGFPDLTVGDVSSRIRFVGLRNSTDPLYYHQVVWLEKLVEFGIKAEECQVSLVR